MSAFAKWQHDKDAAEHKAEIGYWETESKGVMISHMGIQHETLTIDLPGKTPLRNLLSCLIGKVNSSLGGWCEIHSGGSLLYRHSGERHPETGRYSVQPDGKGI